MPILGQPFVSYHLWSLIVPAAGQERWHCQMKRGFIKAKQKEPIVQSLLTQASIPQRIGLLAQKGVYEFHRHRQFLTQPDGVERVAQLLKLGKLTVQVQQRVTQILKNYHSHPLLAGKQIVELTSGEEGFPKPIWIEQQNYRFRLYATMDCILTESDKTLHIIDFKTGKSIFDQRQAFVYLVAARYLYPQYTAVASFYNLEQCKKSALIRVTPSQLDAIENQLASLALRHQQDINNYEQNPYNFSKIFPPNPGYHCRYCSFNAICEFSNFKPSK